MGRIGDWDIFQTVFHEIIIICGAVLVYWYTGEFLLFSYPYMEL